MNREIKYIGFYDLPDTKCSRVHNIAATNKMDYISDALNRAGFDVWLISPSWIDDSKCAIKFNRQKTIQLNEHKRITFCPSYVTNNIWSRNIKIISTLSWLFLWLIFNTRRDEKILVYHVQWLSLPLRWAKKVRGFKIILEVEEIYEKVWENKKTLINWERKLLKEADSYIAVSDVLADILGDKVKSIIYGSYAINTQSSAPLDNNKINVVYAGSIDSKKGGAINAVKCSEFLTEEYILHVLGTGNSGELKIINEEIKRVNAKLKREACIFHGQKIGDEFNQYMNKFNIGINPQFEGDYMGTAFPSKIIKYLSYNLHVVSTRIKSIEKSKIAPIIVFAKDDLPESIAYAIMHLDLTTEYDAKQILLQLDRKFISDMQKIFKNL